MHLNAGILGLDSHCSKLSMKKKRHGLSWSTERWTGFGGKGGQKAWEGPTFRRLRCRVGPG